MITMPAPHAIAALLLATAMFYAFANGRLRVEIISLMTIGVIALGLYVAPLPGGSPKDGLALAFEGFGHHALVTICALMIMGRGLVVTGALDPAARALRRIWLVNRQTGMLVTLVLAMAMSMLINDTPVLVLLLPILVQLAAKGGMAASKTLIPVNAAVLIGGMATTIGTSTNLLVVSIASDLGLPQMSVFHYTPIVLVAAVIALPYLWLVMPRILPDNSVTGGSQPRQFHSLLRMQPGSAFIGQPVSALLAALPPEVEPASPYVDSSAIVDPDTRIGIVGPQDALEDAARAVGSTLAPAWLMNRVRKAASDEGEDLVVADMAIAPDSRLIDLTLSTAGLKGIAVLGVEQARRLTQERRALSAQAPLSEGDVLMVMGTMPQLQEFARNESLLMLEGARDMPRSAKALLALAIMIGAVALASVGLVPIAISSLGGAVLMFVTGCVKFERVGRALSAQVIVLVAASIALGKLVLVSGAAQWLGEVLAIGMVYLPAAGVLAAIMVFVTLLTNFASNATAAAVGTPIAFSLAQTLGLPPEPLVLAVLFGCNLCYATPVAYQTNMMIMAEGDYRFADYIRTGVPLVVIMIVTLSALLALRYGL